MPHISEHPRNLKVLGHIPSPSKKISGLNNKSQFVRIFHNHLIAFSLHCMRLLHVLEIPNFALSTKTFPFIQETNK